MTTYKHLLERPSPKIDSTIKIKRTLGGYIIDVGSMTTNDLRFWPPFQIVCKCFNEVVLILKDWEQAPEEQTND